MRVALVFPGVHRRGGVERSIWEMARLWKHDHQVTVVAADVDRADLDGVEVRLVDAGKAGPWRFGRAARRLYRLDEFDHVISFGVQPTPATVAWVGSVHRAWLEASWRFPGASRLKHPALRYLLPRHQERLLLESWYFRVKHRARVVVVADAVGHDLQRLYGVDPALVTTVHNGFDPAEFDPSRRGRDRAAARAAWGLPSDAVVLCMVANELPRKGWDILLRATAATGDDRVHLVVAGAADNSSYAGLVTQLSLDGRVHHLGHQPDVGRVHAASDAYVMPTKYEAFCLAIIEALASGLPVVTTTVPGAGDAVTHGVNGLLQHDPDDVDELTTLLHELLDDDRRAALAVRARPSVEHLTWARLLTAAIGDLAAHPAATR